MRSMPRHRPPLAAALLAAALLAQPAAHAADPAPSGPMAPQGRWITASGNLEVEIAPCGEALCGTVTRVLDNRSMSRPGTEMQAAGARPALGMVLLRDFRPVEHTRGTPLQWLGEIYNRENGKTYRCQMWMETGRTGQDSLGLRPYVGLPLFGKTQQWHRPAAPGTAAAHP